MIELRLKTGLLQKTASAFVRRCFNLDKIISAWNIPADFNLKSVTDLNWQGQKMFDIYNLTETVNGPYLRTNYKTFSSRGVHPVTRRACQLW